MTGSFGCFRCGKLVHHWAGIYSFISELNALPLDDAIRLKWVLRDIRSRRVTLSPPDPADLETLICMGYVELKESESALTPAGFDQI